MSEDAFEHGSPVMVLSQARKESGQKAVKQKPRRRKRVSQRYEHSEEQAKGRRKDFHLQISSPRWRELNTDTSDSSSTDESHWVQSKRRAQIKFRLSRRRRSNLKACGTLAGSSTPDRIELVELGSKGEQHQELMECESHSLNICRGKVTKYQGCSSPQPRGSVEKRPPESPAGSKGRCYPRKSQLLHTLRKKETITKRFAETDSDSEMLAATEGGEHVADSGLRVSTSSQKPTDVCDNGSDNCAVCRSVAKRKNWIAPKYSSACDLGVCLNIPQSMTFTCTVPLGAAIKWKAKGYEPRHKSVRFILCLLINGLF